MSNNSGGMGFWGIVGAIIVALLSSLYSSIRGKRETKSNIFILLLIAAVYSVNFRFG